MDKVEFFVPYVPECEQLGNERTDYCTACDAYKKLEAERDAAVARYEYLRRLNVPQFQELFMRTLRGERFDDMVDAAIDAASGEV